jgi:predicted RNA-binding protein
MTAVQQVFSELETLFPNYFNVYTTEGKEFINHFHKYLAVEKQQIVKAHINGQSEFDKEKFRQYNKELAQAYYNQTYKSEQ